MVWRTFARSATASSTIVAIGAALLLGCAAAETDEVPTGVTTVNPQISNVLASLPDTLLFSSDEERIVDEVYERLDPVEEEGMGLRAPGELDTSKVDGFPVVFVSRESGKRSSLLALGDNCFVAVHHLDSGQFWTERCFGPPAEKIPMPPSDDPGAARPPPEADDQAGATTVVELLDLKKLLELDLDAGRYSVAAISYDWLAAPVVSEVRAGPATQPKKLYQIEDAIAVMDRYEMGAGASEQFPHARRAAQSPPLGRPGAAIQAPAVYSPASDRLPVHITFQVRVRESWLVEAIGEDALGDLEPGEDAVYSQMPAAIVPAMILVTQLGVATPRAARYEVPILSTATLHAGDVAEGFLAVDLADLAKELGPGMYGIYLMVGEYVAGPRPLKIEAAE